MKIERLEVGPLMANCYIVGCDDTNRGFIVDPGGDAQAIVAAAEASGLVFDCILDTHAHPDHTDANDAVRSALNEQQDTAVRLIAHERAQGDIENPPLHWLLANIQPHGCSVDEIVQEGDTITVGELAIRIMHVPGHSPGSIALIVDDAAFTGDLLFAGGVGRTDLPGGNADQMAASLRRLIDELPASTAIYPGHGPESTIGEERSTNPWLAEI